jgi:tetratricopeptide (TPR) repeat protein
VCPAVCIWPSLIVLFQAEVVVNIHVNLSDMRGDVSKIQEGFSGQVQSVSELDSICREPENAYSFVGPNQVSSFDYQGIQYLTFASSVLGESPPPPPRACFGRDKLIENIVGLAEKLTPIALIGAGGIGKTSVALTALHDDRIKQRFGENRRFIRCDQFLASRAQFLSRLSKVIGAGVENPEDLTPLRPFLSSNEILIVLDNAESILDPQRTGAREIYTVVEELSQFKTMCLCVTSRITTVPRHCKHLAIPTLSMEAACDIFYGIYDDGRRSDIISDLLQQLDFHALSIALLATTASHNMWDYDRLFREWDARRTQVLRTDYNEDLAATIELSLTSSMFRELGPDARDLLGVIAFFPQGVNEDNLDWLFPTISSRRSVFDKFCVLSLTYRSDRFITMLAPLRDYLCPEDPTSSPLLRMTKECYFGRLLIFVNPGSPGYEEARWITSEDVNVEHLLDVFTSIDANSCNIWDACANFMRHLYWYKPRLVVLEPNLEGLSDNHPSKPKCLFHLSHLFCSIGNHAGYKRLLTRTLKLWREWGDDSNVAITLRFLAYANWRLLLLEEGILQAKELLEISERLNDVSGQARSLQQLARLLWCNNQLDAAEEAASRSIDLLPDGEQLEVCQGRRVLGDICRSKGEIEKAVDHFEVALRIADLFDWHGEQFSALCSLAELFSDQGRFDHAHTHVERAKSHTVNNAYSVGHTMGLQALIWHRQRRLKEAKSEALCAAGVFEKLGAAKELEDCRNILQWIEEEMNGLVTSGESDFDGELPEMLPLPTPINSPSLAQEAEWQRRRLPRFLSPYPSANFHQLHPS